MAEADAANGGSDLYATYYRSIASWSERTAVSGLACPRFAFAGTEDRFVAGGHEIHIGATLASHRDELQQLGWVVRLVPGVGHELGGRPDIVIPLLQEFLDPILG